MQDYTVEKIEISAVKIKRNKRQRRGLDNIEEMSESLATLGQINPIVIDAEGVLIAGERRIAAAKHLGWTHIVATRWEGLTELQKLSVEYDENVKRVDLSWQDKANALARLHEHYCKDNGEDWTAASTALAHGHSKNHVSMSLHVAQALADKHSRVLEAQTLRAADNILVRERERRADDASARLDLSILDDEIASSETLTEAVPAEEPKLSAARDFICADFTEWAPAYEGEPFNVAHVDFPYGINHGKSDQGGAASHGTYDDSEETYWKLCKAFVDNMDNFLLPSAHVIFWMSMNNYKETIKFFTDAGLKLVMPHPLIWHKSDNRGIVSDVTRRPRHIYETALLFTRGDRKIIEAVGDVYSGPTAKAKAAHLSEKSEAMLKHFFRLFVDGLAEVLDPTAGSGSALRAAEAQGAKRVFGLEIDSENHAIGVTMLQQSRNLRAASEAAREGE